MNEFEYLKIMVQPKSTCQKKAVAAGCYVGEQFLTAANYCENTGQVCERLDKRTGTSTELCNSTHAEITLLDKHICPDCAEALHQFGIREIRIREH